jgi:hypothetical protein
MFSSEFSSSRSDIFYSKNIFEGEVVSLLDGEENGIIRVRIKEIDTALNDEDLPLCFPLFNFSFFRILPKVGERVTLMFRNVYNTSNYNSKDIRYWISVVHSNVYNIENQDFAYESNRHYPDGILKYPKKSSTIAESKGIFAKKDEISINGRNNVNIFLKERQLLLRVGGHELNNPLKFNKVNPSYQLLSFPEKKDKKVEKKNLNVKTFKNPTIEFVVQFISDFAATIIVKDISNPANIKVLSSTRYTKSSKDELVVEIKSQLLTLQSTYPLWKLTSTDPSLAALPKLYPPTPLDTNREENILVEKYLDFSTSLTVSDKIFLVSHLNNEFDLKKQPDLVTDADIVNLAEKGHPIPYGDRLVELLSLMRDVLATHIHPEHAMVAVREENLLKLLNFDLQRILNKNVLTG